ncbi:MAG TPA: tetratricopeptide repeat protein [Casimicrobiaceae bacterium]|nr:tetratricopeptide repeat protein [Casimicrobiaceae bacterium]
MKAARTLVAIAISGWLLAADARASSVSTFPSDAAGAPVTRATALLNVTTLEALVAACEAGDTEAMNSLGVLYSMGTQVPRDYPAALFLFQTAIDGGSSNAMGNLATMYLLGLGVPRDPANAFRWFERSAAHGNAQSAYSAAVMADEGVGTPRDPRLARTLYRRAAEAGSIVAMVKLSEHSGRSTDKRELIDAYAWLLVAAQSVVPAELQMLVLARTDKVAALIPADRRDDARALATRRLASLRMQSVAGQAASAAPTMPTAQEAHR